MRVWCLYIYLTVAEENIVLFYLITILCISFLEKEGEKSEMIFATVRGSKVLFVPMLEISTTQIAELRSRLAELGDSL
jgi:hypothetical protein